MSELVVTPGRRLSAIQNRCFLALDALSSECLDPLLRHGFGAGDRALTSLGSGRTFGTSGANSQATALHVAGTLEMGRVEIGPAAACNSLDRRPFTIFAGLDVRRLLLPTAARSGGPFSSVEPVTPPRPVSSVE